MSFIRKNIWGVGFAILFIGALVAMWTAGSSTRLPSQIGPAKDETTFEIGTGDNIKGSSDAKVTIVEFSDFQCPACKSYAPVLDEIVKEFPNDMRLVYKHFPLKSIHLRAEAAARASEAAALQGKFWEMSSLLFSNQDIWTKRNGNEIFAQYATELGLDIEKFNSDIASDAVKAAVDADQALGISLNVNGTPTIYVNGKRIENPRSFDEFKALIQTEVTK